MPEIVRGTPERPLNLDQLAANGVFRLAANILQIDYDLPRFRAWLERRYGNVTANAARGTLRRVQESSGAALVLNETLASGVSPLVPADPSINRVDEYRYVVRVSLLDPDEARRSTPASRTIVEYHTYTTRSRLTLKELMPRVRASIRLDYRTRDQRAGSNSPPPTGWQEYPIQGELVTVFRGR